MKRPVAPLLALTGLCLAALTLTGCAHGARDAGVPQVQPISESEATQIGIQSMNQAESWEPNVEYETRRDGKFWKVYGYKTLGKDLHGKAIYDPGVVRVITLSPYGKVIDFWREAPKKAGQS